MLSIIKTISSFTCLTTLTANLSIFVAILVLLWFFQGDVGAPGGAPYPIHDWWWKMSVEAVITAEEDGFRPGQERDYLGLFYNKC